MFIDTHCHLDFLNDLEIQLKKSREIVSKFVLPSINRKSTRKSLKIIEGNNDVFLAVGIHPDETKEEDLVLEMLHPSKDKQEKFFNLEEELEFYNNFLEKFNKNIVGIGECGLDLEKDITNLANQSVVENTEVQIQLFKEHIQWASKYNKPLIIHNRRGNDLLYELLVNKGLRGVFHCYASSRKFIRKVMELGFYFGIGGMLTLDEGLQRVVKEIPLDKIVLETDTPYLTPKEIRKAEPFPNIPYNIIYTAKILAKIKEISEEEVALITNKNAEVLFRI